MMMNFYIMKRFLAIGMFLSFIILRFGGPTNLVKVTYTPTDEIFPNPERGFYQFFPGTLTTPPLDPDTLKMYRAENRTMIFRPYLIRDFIDSDISEEFLIKMRDDLQTLRESGMKTLFKFRYSTAIGEPDAPLERVLSHIDQLAPVLEEYYDVIAVVQAGFIGAWGEWHASTNDLTSTENMRTITHKILDVLPPDRHIQIRYPDSKMRIFSSLNPISEENAFDGSYKSRTGHHNDCFLASPTDVGTYWQGRYRYPFFDEVRDTFTIDNLKHYLHNDTRYVPMGGETCNPRPDAGDRYHCENALKELAELRYSFLNHNYSRRILNTWIEQGCMPAIERRLGYRITMLEGAYSESVTPGGIFNFNLKLTNEGFASTYNPRVVQVILRQIDNPDQIYIVNLPEDPRRWFGGEEINLNYKLGIPENLIDGEYEILLNLPDPAETLHHDPAFSIRLANNGSWEETTGFNLLNYRFLIDSSGTARNYKGNLMFKPVE